MPLPKLVFATRNPGKVREIADLLSAHYDIIGLDEVGCREDIPETAPTLEGNAIQKAEYVLHNFGVHCFADDTGLEVNALGGAPGCEATRPPTHCRLIAEPRAPIHDQHSLTQPNPSESGQSTLIKLVEYCLCGGQGDA